MDSECLDIFSLMNHLGMSPDGGYTTEQMAQLSKLLMGQGQNMLQQRPAANQGQMPSPANSNSQLGQQGMMGTPNLNTTPNPNNFQQNVQQGRFANNLGISLAGLDQNTRLQAMNMVAAAGQQQQQQQQPTPSTQNIQLQNQQQLGQIMQQNQSNQFQHNNNSPALNAAQVQALRQTPGSTNMTFGGSHISQPGNDGSQTSGLGLDALGAGGGGGGGMDSSEVSLIFVEFCLTVVLTFIFPPRPLRLNSELCRNSTAALPMHSMVSN
jgi:hypothetical protein